MKSKSFLVNLIICYCYRLKLIEQLPPLAPTASSEDLSSSDIENARTGSASPSFLSTNDQLEEYAIDMDTPPILNKLPSLAKFPRPKRPTRAPTAEFLRRNSSVKFHLF
jgi:hypothetical protein